MAKRPSIGTEDRSNWRYEENGAPLKVAAKFLDLMKSGNTSARVRELSGLATTASLPTWIAAFKAGFSQPYLNELNLLSERVRYPADGMAYVFCLIAHPDQTERMSIGGPTYAWMHVVTLLEEEGEWRVHQVGEMASPAQVGKTAYSW